MDYVDQSNNMDEKTIEIITTSIQKHIKRGTLHLAGPELAPYEPLRIKILPLSREFLETFRRQQLAEILQFISADNVCLQNHSKYQLIERLLNISYFWIKDPEFPWTSENNSFMLRFFSLSQGWHENIKKEEKTPLIIWFFTKPKDL